MLHPQAAKVIAATADDISVADARFDVVAERERVRKANLKQPREDVARVEDLDARGVRVRLYAAPDAHGVIVHAHGGGFVLNDIDVHDRIARMLANRSGATVISVDYRRPPEHPYPAAVDDMDAVVAMVEGVKALGMETCMTLGMLSDDDIGRLSSAGLDYYNHNVDTSESYYSKVITTRSYADRLDTLARVRDAGIKVCSGGIVGMGEGRADRADMLVTLANLDEHPDSVPINMLIAIPGTPLENTEKIDAIDFVRTIAVARIMMPKSYVRLSAGRTEMSDEMQAMCFFAGANSIFAGETLLTAANPGEDHDSRLFAKLGITPMELADHSDQVCRGSEDPPASRSRQDVSHA